MCFMQHRACKKLVAWLLAIALPLLGLQGCGGGGGGGPSASPPPVPTQKASGTVNQSELGETGLKVVSAYQEAAPVAQNGTFTTTVSQNGTQLLFLLDQQNQLRGLSLSIPQTKGTRQTQILPIDIESTVLSIIFLSPGIFLLDPAEAQNRIQEIKNLPSFSDAVNFVRQNISNKPLQDILKDDTFNQKLINCIEDWLKNHPITTKSRDIIPSGPKASFSVSVKDQSNPSNVSLTLDNKGWRYVNVARRDLDTTGKEVRVKYVADGLNSMGGGIPASLGSVFTGTFANSTQREDIINFTNPALGKVEYWIIGPGISSGSDALPSTIQTSSVDAWGLSLVAYFLFPILQAVSGTSISFIPDKVKEVWQIFAVNAEIVKIIKASMNPTDFGALLSSIANALSHILGLIAGEALKTIETILSISLSNIALPLSTLSISFAIANVLIGAINWFSLPQVAKVEVYATSGADVVIK